MCSHSQNSSTDTKKCTNFGPVLLNNSEWTVQMAQSLNASGGSPTYSVNTVTERPVKHGQICLGGLGCTGSTSDRSLGDFLQVKADNNGADKDGADKDGRAFWVHRHPALEDFSRYGHTYIDDEGFH